MKRRILIISLVVILLASCATQTAIDNQPTVTTETVIASEGTSIPIEKVEVGRMLDGQVTYECDELGFNLYTWTSQISFKHVEAVVHISFTDLDALYGETTTLAFIIKTPSLPNADARWLYVRTDGTFDPNVMNFDGVNGPMDVYPGGYTAFEKELGDMNIDWVNMYLKSKAEFLSMYLSNNEQCAPPIQLDTQSG